MEYVAQTVQGIEDIAALEIEELASAKAETIKPGRLLFKPKNTDACNNARSISRVYRLLARFDFLEIDDIIKKAESISYDFQGTFAVRCHRSGNHSFNSQDVAVSVGEVIFKKGMKVSLECPDFIVLVDIIDNYCLIGVDVTGKDLAKREYRVKANKQSINACVAYAMLRIAEWNAKESLLDPSSKDGVIPIEAALLAKGKSLKKNPEIFAYDPLFANVRSSEINAKLAGINKMLTFGRCDISWLDTKFKKGEIKKIITSLPSFEEKEFVKMIKEFFYQAEFILDKKGMILLSTTKPELVSDERFEILGKRLIIIGGFSYSLVLLKKSA